MQDPTIVRRPDQRWGVRKAVDSCQYMVPFKSGDSQGSTCLMYDQSLVGRNMQHVATHPYPQGHSSPMFSPVNMNSSYYPQGGPVLTNRGGAMAVYNDYTSSSIGQTNYPASPGGYQHYMPATVAYSSTESSPGCGPQHHVPFAATWSHGSYCRISTSRRSRHLAYLDPTMRTRPCFTAHQTNELEREFLKSQYITKARRMELSSLLVLSEQQIKTWFQNRRVKERKTQKAQEKTATCS